MKRSDFIFLTLIWAVLAQVVMAQHPEFSPRGPGGGGYQYSPAISPHDPDDAFLVCDMAGVYSTRDGGHHWALIPFQEIVSTVKGQIQFTTDPMICFSVSRSLTNQNDPLFRGEPVRSSDGGLSWEKMNDPTSSGVHRLFADPSSTQRILLSEYDRLFYSSDGGQNYQEVWVPDDGRCWLGGVVWVGEDIYIGTHQGLLVSHDGGQQFDLENYPGLPSGSGIFQLAGTVDPIGLHLFAITCQADQMNAWLEVLDLESFLDGFFQLTIDSNGGSAWLDTRGNMPEDVRVQWVDLSAGQSEIVWATGDIEDQPMVFRSDDGGLSWTNTFLIDQNANIQTGWGGDGGAFSYQWGGRPLGLDVSTNDPDHVLVTDGFSHQTKDGGVTWEAIYVTPESRHAAGQLSQVDAFYQSSGINVTTGHHLLFMARDSIFSANTDIGQTWTEDGGVSWTFKRNVFYPWGGVSDNNWYRMLRHPDGQTLYAAVADVNDMYLGYRITDESIEWSDGMVLHSTDQGMTWDTLHYFGRPVVWLAQDPNSPDRLFASVVHHEEGGIYRSLDGGITWEKCPLPSRTEGHPYTIEVLQDGSVVVTFSARAESDGVTLTPSSGVFYSADGGLTWTDKSNAEMLYYTKDLVVDSNDPDQNTWYVTVWGRFTVFPGPVNEGNGGLYRTTDRGDSWERIWSHERTESVTFHPSNQDVLYMTVEDEGLFLSTNIQDDQPLFSLVAEFPFPRPKRVFFNPFDEQDMWVTTMGGGLWQCTLAPTTRWFAPELSNWRISPNPANAQITLIIPYGYDAFGLEMEFVDIAGRVVKRVSISELNPVFDVADLVEGAWAFRLKRGDAHIAQGRFIISR